MSNRDKFHLVTEFDEPPERKYSDSIETLNELASFLPKEYSNLRTAESIPKENEHLHKTCALANAHMQRIGDKSSALNIEVSELLETCSLPPKTIRRSKSLKSSLKKSASSSAKKAVRFADSLGLDLENTSHIQVSNVDDATEVITTQLFVPYNPTSSSMPKFAPLFALPSVMKIDKILDSRQVCLESIAVGGYFVKGIVKVKNLAFEKKITVRYTTDDWVTCADVDATYIRFASDGFTDKFSFTIDLMDKGDKVKTIQFAVRFRAAGVGEFWDNNNEQNYCFKNEGAKRTLETQPSWYDNAWLHFN